MALETMWLDEEDIESADGTPVPIEQPTEIKTPPLSMDDPDDRIRAAFGLTHMVMDYAYWFHNWR